ncbi:hypothetical protein ACFFLS_04600 [Flavobacterium procerum]|uniref:RDD domain-containing protein n=1 Tax=Flavobacterium procerum TaxID=1455569 RepID=A0ABV6BLK0_9FLAO
MEKFEIDIKWASYFLITNIVTTIFIIALICLIDFYSLRYLPDILAPVFIMQLFYFTIKAIRENDENGLSKGFRKFFVFFRLLTFYLMLAPFLSGGNNGSFWCFSLLFPYRKRDVSELSKEIDFIEEEGMSSSDLLAIFKKRKPVRRYY